MSGPFDDLDPAGAADAAEREREVPAGDHAPAVPEPAAIEGDRVRRPTASSRSTTRPSIVDRRPRRSAGSPPRTRPERHDPRRRPEVGGFRAFLRGLVRHCPRCGGGQLFHHWLKIKERCPRCGFRLEREEGGFLGAMTINYAVTAVVWLAVFVTWLVVDLPDVHALQLTIVSIAVAVLVPLLFWPFSKTLWAVVDYLVTESEGPHVPDRPPDVD